ncbi:MAG: Mut7-C RNAse domain-containing protein [Thermoplasmata archaeon]|nr:Mut7-C RNAse domain-containing protein [Thermoplasmata archaeon]
MKLILDAMLGSLARRLRLMGVDVLYMRDEEDKDIVVLARETERWLVTRDIQLAERTAPRSLLLRTTDPEEGWDILLQWLREKGTRFEPGSRCSVCNTPLITVDPQEVMDRLPDSVRSSGKEVRSCTGCGRLYWKGSHWDKIMEYAPEEAREDGEWEEEGGGAGGGGWI